MVLLLPLSVALLVPSIIGAISYFVCRKMKPTPKHLLAALGGYFLFSVLTETFGPSMFLLIVVAVFSKAGAWGHTKSVERLETGWESPYDLVMLASLLTIFAGGAALFGIYLAWPFLLSIFPELFVLLYFVALVSSPSLTPFLVWMLQNMKLRPGIDKHFED